MPGNSQILGLLEEMLDSGKTPEEVCRNHPELLPEVRQRWEEFQFVDGQVKTLLPGLATRPDGGDATTPPDRLPHVPGYELEAILGRGGMGVVYKARHLALKRTVAIKMLAAGHPNPVEQARFRAEAEAVARLAHPNIVQIHEIGETDGRPFFALEYVAGGSLADRLAGKSIPPRDAARLVATLANAMHLAHSRNLVHRDLKPANILLSGVRGQESGVRGQESVASSLTPDSCSLTPVPKITDFGLVRQLDIDSGHTFDGVVMGTPSYMAPEQAEGRARCAGPAADVYALGATLYECLTGQPPFKGATAHETLLQVRGQEPIAPSVLNRQVPRDLETICLKCLRKLPEKRYCSAQALAEDLGRFVRGEPVAARPVGVIERVWKWMWRRPAVAGLLAAVVVLVAVGGAGGWLLSRQRAAARERQAKTDRDVRRALEQASGLLEKGWQTADLAILTEAAAEGNRAEGMARSGVASAPVQEEVEAFRGDVKRRREQAENNRTLLEALLDVSAPQEIGTQRRGEAVGAVAPAQPSADEQYAAAFRRWGLDVGSAPEDEVVARLATEPDAVVQELIAALDGWMMARRGRAASRERKRPEEQWRRLNRIAETLDRTGRHRRLRALLAGGSPPRPESVAGLLAARSPWAALWELSRGTDWRQLQAVRGEFDPASEPIITVVLLAQACAAVGDEAGAEQVLRQAAAARPDQVVLLDALGKLLERQGPSRRAKAIEYYRAARARRPGLGIALSAALVRASRADEAEEVLQELTRQQPDNPVLYNTLGISLSTQQKHGAAEAAYRKAIELKLDFAVAHYNLGLALASQGRHAAAETASRKAIELKPDYAEAHVLLGRELSLQKKQLAAEAAYHKAIELKPEFAQAHVNFSNALLVQGKYRAAEAACRKAIELQPGLVEAHSNLGNALLGQEQPGAAEAAYRKAIQLRPDSAAAHSNLGSALAAQQKYRDAEAAFRRAIELQPDLAEAYDNLGSALSGQGRHGAAEAAYRKAIHLQAHFVPTYFNLAQSLSEQAKFGEALAIIKKGLDLLPTQDPLRDETLPLLQQCRRYVALDARLPRILKGAEKPGNAAEQIVFAELCRLKKLYTASSRLYAAAFAAEPKLAQDVPKGIRYHAACAAARAACAKGKDAEKTDGKERARWRRQALDWLRNDLAWWARNTEKGTSQLRLIARQRLQLAQDDPELAGVRDRDGLARLPNEEREQCERLWSEVDALLRRVSRPE
jgi:serine/threonine-protein kinase